MEPDPKMDIDVFAAKMGIDIVFFTGEDERDICSLHPMSDLARGIVASNYGEQVTSLENPVIEYGSHLKEEIIEAIQGSGLMLMEIKARYTDDPDTWTLSKVNLTRGRTPLYFPSMLRAMMRKEGFDV